MSLGHLGRKKEAQVELDECERLHPGFVDKRADWHPYLDDEGNLHLREGRLKAGLTH